MTGAMDNGAKTAASAAPFALAARRHRADGKMGYALSTGKSGIMWPWINHIPLRQRMRIGSCSTLDWCCNQ